MIQKFWYTYFRHTRKNTHLSFFIVGFIRYIFPKTILRKRLAQ